MNAVVNLWIAAPVLGTAVILQWIMLRMKHRNELTKRHARHVQQQQITTSHIEQAKRQIGQLQHDLAAARLQVKRLSMSRAAPQQSDTRAKEALERMLDDASASRSHLPTDGFADTQPSPHSRQDIDLLLR
jgi:hypothetical protein